MGSGGSKNHESFTVAPGADDTNAGAPAAEATTHNQSEAADSSAMEYLENNFGIPANYDDLVDAVHDSQVSLDASELPAEVVSAAHQQLNDEAKHWLSTQPDETLKELAAEHGLAHAEMVSAKAAAAWLHPTTDDHAKHKIQKLAQQHYDEQLAAGTVTALAPSEVPDGCWEATPAQLLAAQSTFTAAYTAAAASTDDPAAFDAVVAAETTLATAHCPQAPAEAAAAAAAATAGVDALVHTHPDTARAWVHQQQQQPDSSVPAEALSYLSLAETTRLARASTPPADIALLHNAVKMRRSEYQGATSALTKMAAHHPKGDLATNPTLSTSEDVADYAFWVVAYENARTGTLSWNDPGHVDAPQSLTYVSNIAMATRFRAGSKKVPMAAMRQAATQVGLDSSLAKHATRAQLQNYCLGPVLGSNKQDQITVALQAKLPPSAPSAPSPSKASTAGHGANSPRTAGTGAWAAKHRQLIASLQHHSATLADLPARPDQAQVASWNFTDGPAMALGGAHTKSVHTAPDGSHWLYKPQGGARATSDVTANTILHRVGIPTVPVYQRQLGHQTGTIQPLITGATQLTNKPDQWSQADVDAIVRYHAAAWVIGDHDAKHDNLLRTPSGGLVPIDHGQAFKFYGRDKLSSTYHPNGSYGAKEPVWNTLYRAAKDGKLAPGVTVRTAAAVPVIKAFEAIPDTEYAALIRPTATAGAKSPNIHWRSALADPAQTTRNPHPPLTQIADQFVDHAVARKNTLRAEFTAFFAKEKLTGADVLQKVA